MSIFRIRHDTQYEALAVYEDRDAMNVSAFIGEPAGQR
jgi:hypothetical protein